MTPEFEIEVHWSATQPAVLARLGTDEVRELFDQLTSLAPHELPMPTRPDATDPWTLLLGLQSFYRMILARDAHVALAGIDGDLWTIPARQVQAIRVRYLGSGARTSGTAGADSPRTVFAGTADEPRAGRAQ